MDRPCLSIMVVVVVLALPSSTLLPKASVKVGATCFVKKRSHWQLHKGGVETCQAIAKRHGIVWPNQSWLPAGYVAGSVVAAVLCEDFQCKAHRGEVIAVVFLTYKLYVFRWCVWPNIRCLLAGLLDYEQQRVLADYFMLGRHLALHGLVFSEVLDIYIFGEPHCTPSSRWDRRHRDFRKMMKMESCKASGNMLAHGMESKFASKMS